MSKMSIEDLQAMARETIGRDLSADEADYFRNRLPMVARAIGLLQEWEPRLRDVEPACRHQVVEGRE